MERQHSVPILLCSGGALPLEYLTERASGGGVNEAFIRDLVHQHPACLPITEIDAMFSGAVSICTELNTPAGPIDVFMVTPSGLPVLVECKLWRNPEARREVVSQILDYAKELSRWSSADVQREVSNRLKRNGNPLLEMVRVADPAVDEQGFHDALTANLRRGRFLLLIVGDGIREGVEAIAEYLQVHAGLHFSLGLVELPVYLMPNGDRLVAPRVLVRTVLVTRNVVAVPEGYTLEVTEDEEEEEIDPEQTARADELYRFWSEFLKVLKLDDPEQPKAKPSKLYNIFFPLPVPNSWISAYRSLAHGNLGIYLGSTKNTSGRYAVEAITRDFDAIKDQIGGTVRLEKGFGISDRLHVGSLGPARGAPAGVLLACRAG
ncbi:MAG: hypothetical protein JO071_02940 [Deltaproteobacteria bacterium]|nr:hypothetical protein [Deltaproteobacteria bacterium]